MPAVASPRLDRSAAALSGLCLVHCAVAATLVASAAPLAWLGAHWVHAAGLALVAPMAAIALARGWRRHADVTPATVGLAGLAVMAAGQGVDHGEFAEFALTGVGAAIHALGHALNIRALARRTV
jgi:hypothetical protein